MNQISHFEIELAELKRSLVSMGNLAEQMLELGISTIVRPVTEAREQVSVMERKLDELDTAIEDRCHELIALHSPLAKDLRFLISAMRITTDIEQVGDLAESLVKRADYVARHHVITNPEHLQELGTIALRMFNKAMDAFISGKVELAQEVIVDEDRADELTKRCYKDIQALMMTQIPHIKEYTHQLRGVGNLEHVADIAVSIAEEAIYIHRGLLLRHHPQPHDEMRK